MLHLLLLRHAKAIPYAGRDDFQRPLTERGRADAALVGAVIARRTPPPELVIHSGAARTRETANIVLSKLPPGIEISVEPEIYEATRPALLRLVQELPDDSSTVLIVGHNPGIADIARFFSGRGEKDALGRMSVKFPTSGLAVLEFDLASWEDVGGQAGRLVAFTTPAALGGEDF